MVIEKKDLNINDVLFSKTLVLKKMGCDFNSDDDINEVSDLKNYRLRGSITLLDGRIMLFDISRGARYLKNECISMNKLYIDTFCYNSDGNCSRCKEVDEYCFNNNLFYNSDDLLKFINLFSLNKYDFIFIE